MQIIETKMNEEKRGEVGAEAKVQLGEAVDHITGPVIVVGTVAGVEVAIGREMARDDGGGIVPDLVVRIEIVMVREEIEAERGKIEGIVIEIVIRIVTETRKIRLKKRRKSEINLRAMGKGSVFLSKQKRKSRRESRQSLVLRMRRKGLHQEMI